MKEDQTFGDRQRFQPSVLLPEEVLKPFDVLHTIMDSFSVRELHDGLWDLLYYTTASSEADGLPAPVRARYLNLYKDMLRLTEAASLIDQYRLYEKYPIY
jgi:hypothetical protein